MSYIRFLPIGLTLLISACGQTIVRDTNDTLAMPDKQQQSVLLSADESSLYKQAIAAINNNTNEAEAIFMRFIKNRPELAGPWANLALIKYKNNEIKQASNYLQKALELNPAMPNALNLKAQIEVHNGNMKEAEKLYLTALEGNDAYANAHYNIALLYDVYLQEIEKAIKHYKRYVELTENKDTATIDWIQHLESSLKNS